MKFSLEEAKKFYRDILKVSCQATLDSNKELPPKEKVLCTILRVVCEGIKEPMVGIACAYALAEKVWEKLKDEKFS